jgi:hypothetical protein
MGNFSSSVGCGRDVSVHSVAHLQGRGDQGSRQAQVADGPGARSRWGAGSASRGRGVMPRRGIGALQQSPRAWSARGEAWCAVVEHASVAVARSARSLACA